ncbi:MAG TPA: lysophospholipid acyltransferase family protein [Gemmatimonadaceae bacterium]|jgi:hypothetical protein
MTAEEKQERRTARIVASGIWLIRVLAWTWRYRILNDDDVRRFRAAKRPIIFALWHGQMLPLLYQHRDEGVTVLISEHGDGEIIARIARHFGFRTIRGSTSRGAARALLELVREVQSGNELAITPDGPRGPAKSFAPGTVIIAQRGGAPIVPAVVHVPFAWRLGSWDRFIVPKPFAKITVAYGDAIEIDSASAREATGSADRVREAMVAAERRASE